MNISNFIVEILQSGKNVEIKGIGTFSPQTVEAHHDSEKGVFYPKRRSVVFSNGTTGDDSLIDDMAKRECVNRDIAEKMWQSYVEALQEKLAQSGSHVFPGMGTIVRCADGYAFSADPALDLSGNRQGAIENVTMYDSADSDDPFANYEQNMQMVESPEEEPLKQPRTITIKRESTQAEPTQAEPEMPAPTDEQEPVSQEVELPEPTEHAPVQEEVNIVVEPEPETEPENEPDPATATENPEPMAAMADGKEEEPFAPQTDMAEDNADVNNVEVRQVDDGEVLNVLDSIPDSGGIDVMETPVAVKKRKNRTWLWILLAVLLLLLGLGCYFYFGYRPAHGGTMDTAMAALKSDIASIRGGGSEIAQSIDDEIDENNDLGIVSTEAEPVVDEQETPADVNSEETDDVADNADMVADEPVVAEEPEQEVAEPAVAPEPATAASTSKTFKVEDYALLYSLSDNLIEFDDQDIAHGTRIVCNNMSEYVARFLASRRYTSAKAAMMVRIGAYATKRFGEIYDPDKFYPDRFFQQKNDYVHDYFKAQLKTTRERHACVDIQSELMQYSVLDQILREMVDELGLQPDAVKPAAPAQIFPPKTAEEPHAQIVKASKQGFDIVAGFYTNKTTANRMAWILKRQGCDAYIIDKQGLYYVSMGSAPTQTAAEALFRHIKSWYDGDIVIRKL